MLITFNSRETEEPIGINPLHVVMAIPAPGNPEATKLTTVNGDCVVMGSLEQVVIRLTQSQDHGLPRL